MDRSLATFLRSLQTSLNHEDAYRLLPSATSLLCRLSNPLNVKLLSTQLLERDILYSRPVRLSQARQIFSVFHTAALRFREDKKASDPQHTEQLRSSLSETDWITAVVQGAGDSSPRWRHTLMIGALLLATTSQGEEPLFSGLRQRLETALVRSSNLAIREPDGPDSSLAVIFVLSHTFQLLSDVHRAQLNCDLLLPHLIEATLFSTEGLEHGYWIGAIDQDVRQVGQRFNWAGKSASFRRVQEIKSRPLVSSLGPLSRLLGYSIDHVQDRTSILRSVERISEFANNLAVAWRQNKLSEVDQSEDAQYLDMETLNTTLPALLHVLRDTMFAIIITLRSVLGRLLVDPFLAADVNAPALAVRCLLILRSMYFVSHRFGQTSSSQYVFVNFTAIDILNQYTPAAESFLASIKPSTLTQIPVHPLDRLLDLYFLNTAEHFTLTASSGTNKFLLQSAAPYVQSNGDQRLGEMYEAAHSLTLAVFSAPQNANIVPKHVPIYVETLMASFPSMLNARQFRLAIKSVVRLAAPPSPISHAMPLMQAAILDLIAQRLITAPEIILPSDPNVPIESVQPLSEKSVLVLSAVDSLPHLSLSLLDDWLPIAADLLHKVQDPMQRDLCQRRFWEILSSGEMDVERAALCVSWWGSRGGRELVMFGEVPEDDFGYVTMSGGLGQESKLGWLSVLPLRS